MLRPIALLVFLASCGAGGVCAGCAADDGGDGADLPDSFVVTIVMDHAGCVDGSPNRQQIDGARGATPGHDGSETIGVLACAAAVENVDAWVLDCTLTGTPVGLFNGSYKVNLDKGLAAGVVVLDLDTAACDGSYPIATVELLAP